ncbi:hypothetical protein FIE12Z_5524 [Fusarium flagelliforme]|uniref:Uncharacterized protein n=2 Tax=Fusarium flagelliforme TaxID=2675880 RepID=A0A395MR06_9HYPO|nr:hypothetical protein FIE12Z_5524 [Fusarium flagelliforme]
MSATSGAIGFLPKFDNAIDAKPAIKIFWTEDMVFAGIGIAYELGQIETIIASPEIFHTSQLIVIPENDWLCSLTLTTHESPEFENGPLQRRVPLHMLALLEQPLDKAPIEASTHRLNPDVRSPAQKLHITDPLAANFLWARSVPNSNLKLSPCYPHQPDPHLITEHLLFNFDNLEDHGVHKLGIDPQLGLFQVYFHASKGIENRWIGSFKPAVQHIRFENREVIVQCYVTGVERVEGIRLTTTHGRQIIMGKDGPNAKSLVEQDKGQCVMGFYCTWTNRGTPHATLVSFGVFTRDGVIPPDYVIKDTEVDSHNYPWCPSGPAHKPSMQEIDPIYGLITTPSQTRVTWLDCTKPIQTIKFNLCHNTTKPRLPIISITHYFADESKRSGFGPTCVRSLRNTSGNKYPWCHCAYGGAPISELSTRSHYTTNTWEVGESRLKAVRLWMNQGGRLTGLQYVAENDRTSPAWGVCPSDCSVEVELPHTYQTGPALKFFLGSDERNSKGVDFVVVAVQLLSVAMKHKNWKIARTERNELPLDLEEVELEMMRMQLDLERADSGT